MDAEKPGVTEIAELLLTAEIYNRQDKLTENDLPAKIREHFLDPVTEGVNRPICVTAKDIESIYKLENFKDAIRELSFVEQEGWDSGLRLKDFEQGARWFVGQDAHEMIQGNPVLAYYYQKYDPNISYAEARWVRQPLQETQDGLEARLEKLCGDETEDLLELATIKVPGEVRNRLDDLVLTAEQKEEIAKAGKALEHRQYLKEIGLYEIGKILFVGPPGTGKTSSARALSNWFRMPLVEVKLSMIVSKYLGETSRNIDSVFMLAKRLSPCIFFIDEFDYVAKTRTAEDHGAIKRAVNTLLKAIDEVSLVEDGVLLIAATNYPQLLDHAAWRRFDKVLSFALPDVEMRRMILEKVLRRMNAEVDVLEIARLTEGYSGSDLRLVVREAVLNALLEDRKELDRNDLLRAVEEFDRRIANHRQSSND